MATFGGAVANKVPAGEGWDHCHKARMSGQPSIMFVANVVTRSVAGVAACAAPPGVAETGGGRVRIWTGVAGLRASEEIIGNTPLLVASEGRGLRRREPPASSRRAWASSHAGKAGGGDPKVPAHGQPPKAAISAAADCRLMPSLVGRGAS